MGNGTAIINRTTQVYIRVSKEASQLISDSIVVIFVMWHVNVLRPGSVENELNVRIFFLYISYDIYSLISSLPPVIMMEQKDSYICIIGSSIPFIGVEQVTVDCIENDSCFLVEFFFEYVVEPGRIH